MVIVPRTFQIHVTGIVQGVGFRPFIYNLASSLGLTGWVCNTSSGVDIVLSGNSDTLDKFIHVLKNEPPVLSRIDSIHISSIKSTDYTGFEIRESLSVSGEFIAVSPDMSICADCKEELFDPGNRRYRYPFINCTNCGPRFSIIRDIPYDRPSTTMSEFLMCPDCVEEYQNPSDRRYHAQPIACSVCGPHVTFIKPGEPDAFSDEAIHSARIAIRNGLIIAIKGLGGYHLACNALSTESVNRLHELKQRSEKPFALMCFNLEQISKYAETTTSEQLLLQSPQHPIVLLRKKSGVNALDHTAPSQNHLGFMLPYTPLHLLLLEPEDGYPDVLVMTSGNISEEPIAYLDDDAQARLSSLADAFLQHNRPIHMRVDDSVVRVVDNQVYPIRRSRGYAPEPIQMDRDFPQILGCGAELKNTFSLSRDHYVFLSHHIGDLENIETLSSYEQAVHHYRLLYRVEPELVAVDLHPDYLSTRYGEKVSNSSEIPLIRIQHHHAHLASCLADNNYNSEDPVIGLIFDGTGYGTDGNIWGGEVLIGGYRGYNRRFHLQETPLPGGEFAIRNPSKIALAFLYASGIDWASTLPPVSQYNEIQLQTLHKQFAQNINCLHTTSMGRFFDAVSSLMGIRHHITYEGQAAIELENLCDPDENKCYDIPISGNTINSFDVFPQLITDMRNKVLKSRISARFHNGIAKSCLDVCNEIRNESRINKVALSGGVWQNTTLLEKTLSLLKNASFEVFMHHRVPTNDGGISIGQILIAAATIKNT